MKKRVLMVFMIFCIFIGLVLNNITLWMQRNELTAMQKEIYTLHNENTILIKTMARLLDQKVEKILTVDISDGTI